MIPLEQTFYLHHTKYKFSITSVLFITHMYKTLSTGKLVLWNTKKPGTSWWVRLRFICVWMLKQLIIPSVKQSQFSPLVFEGLLQHHLLAWAFFSWHNFCDTRHKNQNQRTVHLNTLWWNQTLWVVVLCAIYTAYTLSQDPNSEKEKIAYISTRKKSNVIFYHGPPNSFFQQLDCYKSKLMLHYD